MATWVELLWALKGQCIMVEACSKEVFLLMLAEKHRDRERRKERLGNSPFRAPPHTVTYLPPSGPRPLSVPPPNVGCNVKVIKYSFLESDLNWQIFC